jgi:FkbM family methyltransferase
MKFSFRAWCAKWAHKWHLRRSFLNQVKGVIHVGANSGQERNDYHQLGLDVIWIEPIPATFERLENNLKDFPNQRAFKYLVTDLDGAKYTFYLANNEEASSSILPFGRVQELYPEIHYTSEITLTGITLASLVKKEGIDLERYQALVLDTQGSELMILRGASEILKHFRFVRAEVADFEAYKGCCLLPEMLEFMQATGFREQRREVIRSLNSVGAYYEITFERDKRSQQK